MPAEKLVVIPNGIDVARFAPPNPIDLQTLGVPSNRRLIAFIGRLEAQKGLSWLLSFAAQLLLSHADHDLLVVGDGSERMALEDLTVDLGIRDRVHFVGWRPNVPAILAASDVLVLPSQWEGMPNVVLEAMAAGKPVMASSAEGVCELLGPLAEEQTVKFGDSDAFVKKLGVLLEDPALRDQLGVENQRRAIAQFSLAAMANKYDILYSAQPS